MKRIGDKPLTPEERRKRYAEKHGDDYIKQQAHKRYLRNKEKVLERSRKWAENNPEKVLAKSAAYRERYPDRTKAALQKYEQTDKAKARTAKYRKSGKAKAYKRIWRKENADAFARQNRLDAARRRARRRGNGAYVISIKDLQRLMSQCCVACGDPGQHVDHIIPVSRGGQHSIGNLQMLCASCNLSKHNKTMSEWRWLRKRLTA